MKLRDYSEGQYLRFSHNQPPGSLDNAGQARMIESERDFLPLIQIF